MKSERWKRIEAENKKYEQQTPYNFCDRWCARCMPEKQMRCKLYQDELEQELTCIAHGKDEHDPEITEQVMRRQFEDREKHLQNLIEEHSIDIDFEFDQEDIYDTGGIPHPRNLLKDDSLVDSADEYFRRAREFLKATFYNKKAVAAKLTNDFKTVAWYHPLLKVKLQRALTSFDDSDDDDDFGLHDFVAQFAICEKSIQASIKALRNILPDYPGQKRVIAQLLALLHNISQRIKNLEESI